MELTILRKRLKALLCLALLLGCLSTSCSSHGDAQDETAAETPAQGSAATSLAPGNADNVKDHVVSICIDAGLYNVMYQTLSKFEQTRPGLTFSFEVIPDPIGQGNAAGEWEQAKARLNIEIMAGSGPDVFILLSGYETASTTEYTLFDDINKVMRSGGFADLSPLFRDGGLSEGDYVMPVLDAGRVGDRLFVAPLMYQIQGVITNENSHARYGLGDAPTSAQLLDASLSATGAGSGASASVLFSNNFERIMPYYLSSSVDYSHGSETIDNEFNRSIMERAKELARVLINHLSIEAVNRTGQVSEGYLEYARSDDFLLFASDLTNLADEASAVAYSGAVPVIDVLTAEDGGIRAVVSLYAAVSASCDQEDAMLLISYLLSEEAMVNYHPQKGAQGWDGFPVRRGIMDRRFNFINGYGFMSTASIPKLPAEYREQFYEVEDHVTAACFPIPIEVRHIMRSYYYDEAYGLSISTDDCIRQMQSYWSKALNE